MIWLRGETVCMPIAVHQCGRLLVDKTHPECPSGKTRLPLGLSNELSSTLWCCCVKIIQPKYDVRVHRDFPSLMK